MENHDKKVWDQIAASLSGDLSEAEEADFQSWVSASDENRKLYDQGKLIWTNSAKRLPMENVSTEKEWDELNRSLLEEDLHEKTFFMKRNTALKIAASLALIFVCLYSIKFFQNDATTFVAANEVVTVYLPDSTKVWLNAHSQLSYTDDFNSRERNITLQGEAFFEVKRDTLRPFIVSMGFSTTRVLGTSFNLHENDSNTILTVAEGVVRFSSERNQANGDGAIALANEKVVYKHESHTILKTKNDKSDFASWRERNNPQYERERTQPAKFLTNSYTWRKNPINQSKIEGRITNSASLVTYSQIVMKVSYVNNNGKQTTTHVTVFDKVQPGQTIEYTKRLLDIFTDTKSLQVEIVTAEIATDAGY